MKKISHCQCINPCGPKPWQGLNHSHSALPEQYTRVDFESITFLCDDFYCKLTLSCVNCTHAIESVAQLHFYGHQFVIKWFMHDFAVDNVWLFS